VQEDGNVNGIDARVSTEFCTLDDAVLGFTMLLGLKPEHTCDPIACLSGVSSLTVPS
jgi:hypothetical protein